MNLFLSDAHTPIWDVCVSTDSAGRETRRTAHYFQNRLIDGRRAWVCANCGCTK
jgi:hypothetical protein